MATQPPYPSSRLSRRAARAAWRAQRAQMRAEMNYYRRPSLAGPLLLLAVGVVALLLETGALPSSRFWPWYSTWWPLVLIALGFVLLAEYFLDRNQPGVARRPLGGSFGLLVLLSLLGLGTHKVVAAHGEWGEPFSEVFGSGNDWMGMMGEEHSRDVDLNEPIADTGTLVIENARGDVEVLAADAGGAGRIVVSAHEVVHASGEGDINRAYKALQPRFERTASGGTLSVSAPEKAERSSVALRVTVPPGLAVSVRTNHGDVSLTGLRGPATVTNTHGSVSADNLGSSLTAQMDHGDVTLHDIAGAVSINGSVDDVAISAVHGQTLLNGDFFGDTRITDVASTVHFHSAHTDLEMGKLPGELSMDHGDLDLDNVAGGLHLRADAKDITIRRLAGDAEISDGNGDVDLEAAMPLGNLNVTANTGSLTVTVPRNASFSLTASASDSDELESEFGGSTDTAGGRKTLSSTVGHGGPRLELTAQHGDLAVRRGEVASASAAAPNPPATPPTHARRLHAAPGDVPSPAVQ